MHTEITGKSLTIIRNGVCNFYDKKFSQPNHIKFIGKEMKNIYKESIPYLSDLAIIDFVENENENDKGVILSNNKLPHCKGFTIFIPLSDFIKNKP